MAKITDYYSPKEIEPSSPGPFLASVVSHQDPTYMGILEVEILRPSGSTQSGSQGQLHQVRYLSPFYGVTKLADTNTDPNANNFTNSQQSYGMWFVPPDVGTTVVVIFIDGDPKRGFWMGCVADDNMNFMLPGIPATQNTVETTPGDNNPDPHLGRAPTGEYNKLIDGNNAPGDPEALKKPQHPLYAILQNQGLSLDDIRGLTTSSARRETPSMVFGVSTPGPLDKRAGARRGTQGKKEYEIKSAPLSRLGGSSFVMDDGDDKFIRMTKANAGPPAYESVEALPDGQKPAGDQTLPHNELVRIRTRTGHQILLHNSEDLIYIANAAGTAWIELSSMGKIDIFAADSISVHTQSDMNFYADRDVNIEAGRNINMKSKTRTQLETMGDLNVLVGGNYKVNVVGDYINVLKDFNVTTTKSINLTSLNTNLKSSNNILMTASTIGENGPPAASALATAPSVLTTFDNIYDLKGSKITSIMKRIPNHEPWPQHENLDPLFMTTSATDRENTEPVTFTANKNNQLIPQYYGVYTTATDTFTKYKGTASSKGA